MKDIGLIIVNYNDYKNTINLIKDVEEFKSIKKIVVVDNKSSDDSVKKIKEKKFKRTKIIELDNNLGYAGAINEGASYLINVLDNPYIICSNTDIRIKNEDVIIKLANEINTSVSCVMPKVKEGSSFKYGWKLTNKYQDLLLNIPLVNRLYNKSIYYDESYFKDEKSYVDVVYGCFFMIDSKVLKKIKFLDENTFLYYEEYVLARKLEKERKLSLVVNDVYIEHKHDATIGNNISRYDKFKTYKKSQLYYETTYNKAGKITICLFKLSTLILSIPYKIKILLKK